MAFSKWIGLLGLMLATQAMAEPDIVTAGTVVIVPAMGIVSRPNNEVVVRFTAQERDKDRSVAASKANQKLKLGIETIKREDPQASLRTRDYDTSPVYPTDKNTGDPDRRMPPVAWVVRHHVEYKTTSLETLPKVVGAVQRDLMVDSVTFGLSQDMRKKLDGERIAAAYKNLYERITDIALAMRKRTSDAVLESVDFEREDRYGNADSIIQLAPNTTRQDPAYRGSDLPDFEAGDTQVNLKIVGKVRFK